ncbi:hypothetical protein ACSBR1_002028 [Camellia fascicularis]
MDNGILLVCTYRQANVIVRLQYELTFARLVGLICDKFDGLVPRAVCMLFDVPGYKKFKMDSDDDIQNMLCLGKSFGLNHIDVLIQARNVTTGGNVGVVDYVEDGVNFHGSLDVSVGHEMDFLPTYCPNRSKTFLSAQWAYGITHVGQCFEGGANEFRDVLCKYAMERGFQFKYFKNDLVRITIVCKFAAATDCAWSVHARVLPSSWLFCVKRFDSVHTCGATVRIYRNPRTRSELVSSVVADRMRGQQLKRPTDVHDWVLKKRGVKCLGITPCRSTNSGGIVSPLWKKNPNSYINLEFDQKSGRFVRYFISFCVCINGFNHCRPLLFLDGTFLKGRLKGNLLAATAKDGNQGVLQGPTLR